MKRPCTKPSPAVETPARLLSNHDLATVRGGTAVIIICAVARKPPPLTPS